MVWLALLIVVAGAVVALLVIQIPRRTLRLAKEADARNALIAELDARLARLSEMRIHARSIFEEAVGRVDVAFQGEENEALHAMRIACHGLLAGLHEQSPILERYFQNHIAVLDFVLGGHQGTSGLFEALEGALKELDRSQAAERSTHPVVLMERRLATGRDVSS